MENKNKDRADKYGTDPELANYEELSDISDSLEQIAKGFSRIELVKIKGEKGDKGDKGDRGDVGPQGKEGKQGVKGERGERGTDGERGEDGKDGKDGKDGRDGKNGRDGKDANEESVIERAVKRIQPQPNGPNGMWYGSANPFNVLQSGTLKATNVKSINFTGSGITSVTNNNGDVTVTVTGGSGTFAVMVPTGTVNGVNTSFVFSSEPSVIVLDNGNTMNKVSSDGTINWTGTTSVTLSQAPNFNIYGF